MKIFNVTVCFSDATKPECGYENVGFIVLANSFSEVENIISKKTMTITSQYKNRFFINPDNIKIELVRADLYTNGDNILNADDYIRTADIAIGTITDN